MIRRWITPQVTKEEQPTGFDSFELRLGDIMRGERATLSKSLLDVQRELKIKATYIAAIENCDITTFETPSFIAGYVRSYARYLGMDPDWTFRRFCLESGFQPTHGMAPSASGPKPGRRPSEPAEALANPHALFLPQRESFWTQIEPRAMGSVLVLIAIMGGLAYGGWAVLQEVQRVTLTPGETTPGVVTELDPAAGAGMSVPLLESGDTAEIAQNLPQPEGLDRIYRPQILEAPVLTSRDGPIAAIDPGLARQTATAQGGDMTAGSAEGADAIQRALASAGHRAVALMPSGATPGERLAALLEPTDVTTVAVPVAEATRVNITLVEPDGVTTKINEPGPRLSADEVEALFQRACALGAGATWLVSCGSLPPGVGDDFHAELTRRCRRPGLKVAITRRATTSLSSRYRYP